MAVSSLLSPSSRQESRQPDMSNLHAARDSAHKVKHQCTLLSSGSYPGTETSRNGKRALGF